MSLNTVLNTGAYILIYEMEPQTLKQASKLIASSSAASMTAPSINNHNNVNGEFSLQSISNSSPGYIWLGF